MLSLQDSFAYDDTAPPPVGSADILFNFPQYAGNGAQVAILIETGIFTTSLTQNLSSKSYSLKLQVQDIFGPNFYSVISGYAQTKLLRGAEPALNDFTIPFSVDYGTGPEGSYEALWFLTTAKYEPQAATSTPTPAHPPVKPASTSTLEPATALGVAPSSSSTAGTLGHVHLADSMNGSTGIHFPVATGITPASSNPDAVIRPSFPTVLLDAYMYMINKTAYVSLLHSAFPNLPAGNESVLLFIVNELIDLSGDYPKYSIEDDATEREAVAKIIKNFDLPDNLTAFDQIKQGFHELLNFPLKMPKMELLDLRGFVKVNAPGTYQITDKDASFYHLSAEYSIRQASQPAAHVSRYVWDPSKPPQNNQINFNFTDAVPVGRIVSPVTVKLKDFRNVDLYNANYTANDPALQKLAILVSFDLPGSVSTSTGDSPTSSLPPLRGKIISLTNRCTLQSTVVIVAKTSATAGWTPVSAGQSDQAGNFMLPYPTGKFTAAEVRVSLAPNHPTALTLNASATNSIPTDFLFILLPDDKDPSSGSSGSSAGKSSDDCACNKSILAGRLPSQDDLIQSEQYMQDVGGTCVNLTTPNRTLREFNYTALVRHTDPDVAEYALTSHSNDDLNNPQTTYRLTRRGKIKRNLIDVDNPIKWEDNDDIGEVDLYQAVTVSTGHILYYKSEFRADGYSLGDLTYSLPLAPGQKKEIVIVEASHSFVGTDTQNMTQSDQLASTLVNERDIVDAVGGSLGEALAGQSSAQTWGISAGGGAAGSSGFVSGNVGVAGGYASASSQASQDSSRDVAGHFNEQIKQGISQNASDYRQQHISVVTTVQEGQNYQTETTVVANHNHCHAMTMLYFQVLRHYAVYQELVDVEECVFVPFLLTKFSMDNIPRWADILSTRLLPVSSNTYMKLATYFTGRPSHPLLPAFDALERVKTNWALVDYPKGKYDEDIIIDVRGQGTITVNIPRPHTKYDYILSLAIVNQQVSSGDSGFMSFVKSMVLGPLSLFTGSDDTQTIQVRAAIFDQFMTMDPTYDRLPPAQCIRVKNFSEVHMKDPNGKDITITPTDFFARDPEDKIMWRSCAQLLGNSTPEEMMEYYFNNQLLSDWDRIWNSSIAPKVYQKILGSMILANISANYSSFGNYRGGEQVMSFSFESAGPLGKARNDPELEFLHIGSNSEVAKDLDDTPVVFQLRTLRLAYSTDHFNGLLYNGAPNANILARTPGNPALDGVKIFCPETAAEQRDPRLDDMYLAQRLIHHLNQNLEYYNRVLFYSLDAQRQFLLLDGFHIEIFDDQGMSMGYRSISSIVKSNLIAVIGNSLVFPVAPGYKVGASFITEKNSDGQSIKQPLLDFYRPDVPPAPYRLSVPTRGIYSEAVIGQCDSCEKVKPDSSQDWTKFNTDDVTAINPVAVPTPSNTAYNPTIKDFAQPMVSIQNAPNLPDPGSGLSATLDLLGKSNLFRDVAGLDANQQNAMKTLLSDNESARAYAQMASGMIAQSHNTTNSSQMLDSMKQKNSEGALPDKDYQGLIKSHFQYRIDGGKQQQADIDQQKAAGKPTPVEAAAQAGLDGMDATASSLDSQGNSQSFTVKGGGRPTAPRTTLAQVTGVNYEPQRKVQGCWAAVLLMMKRWKQRNPALTLQDALTSTVAGSPTRRWLDIYNADTGGLPDSGFLDFCNDEGLEGPTTPASFSLTQYVQWMNDYGPLWFEIDPDYFHRMGIPDPVDHVILLIKIEVDTNNKYWITFIDPEPRTGGMAGGVNTVESSVLWKQFEKQVLTLDPSIAFKVLHFKDKVSTSPSGSSGSGH